MFEVAAYTASKSGIAGLTRALAVEWASSNVTVNAIAPGVFRTDLNSALLDSPRGQELLTRTPMHRFGKLEELARRRGLSGVGCGVVRDGPRPRRRRRVPGERGQPVKAALVISDRDNVATALETLEPGRLVSIGEIQLGPFASGFRTDTSRADERSPPASRSSSTAARSGSRRADIPAGEHVHIHNVASSRGRGDLDVRHMPEPRLAEPSDPTRDPRRWTGPRRPHCRPHARRIGARLRTDS